MKKVNWSTRREIMGSTWVVIGLMFVVGVVITLLDLGYTKIFQALNVLEAT
jgi:preprotein translocase SecE subunit